MPTTENLCIVIYDILQRGFKHAHLQKVRFEETMMNSFEYWGENSRLSNRIIEQLWILSVAKDLLYCSASTEIRRYAQDDNPEIRRP